MRVTLAVPFDGHAANATVEVADAVARHLLDTGRARPAQAATVVVAAEAPVKAAPAEKN